MRKFLRMLSAIITLAFIIGVLIGLTAGISQFIYKAIVG